jgi:hypothetical protein
LSGRKQDGEKNLEGQEVGGDDVTPKIYGGNLVQGAVDKTAEEAMVVHSPTHADCDKGEVLLGKMPRDQKMKSKTKGIILHKLPLRALQCRQ